MHPALSLDIGNGQCFACHSRSGRISTSYEGWHELHEPPAQASDPVQPSPPRFRTIEDDRVFERVLPDIHQQRGLDCIDCHTPAEVMGDGVAHASKSGQLRVACADCHAPAGTSLPTVPASGLDPESRRILAVRAWPGPAAAHHVRTAKGDALVNVVVDPTGRPAMVRKRTGERRELKPTARVCVEGRGHAQAFVRQLPHLVGSPMHRRATRRSTRRERASIGSPMPRSGANGTRRPGRSLRTFLPWASGVSKRPAARRAR